MKELLAFLILALLVPFLQPITDYGSSKLRDRLGVQPKPAAQVQPTPPVIDTNRQQPYIVYHEGLWWKLENNRWYIWRQNQ